MLHLRDMGQNIRVILKVNKKTPFIKAIYIKLNSSNEKITNMKVVGDILWFPKNPRPSSYGKNWVSYDWCKLGNFEKMHVLYPKIDQTWIFGLMGLCFKVQTCNRPHSEPLNLLIHPVYFYSIYFLFYLFKFKIK